jgi:glutamate synthase (NADPH/NADH) small chain
MGKPTGFLEYERETSIEIAPEERIKNFNEFHIPLSLEEQKIQAARCMDCGVPFCQAGMMIGGMASGCPLNNLIPEWNDMIYNDNWEHAYARLSKTNNFPEFTSRVCPALCEKACTCNINGDPVSVRENERAIIEYAYANGLVNDQPPKGKTDKKVAVIGSGPSGLAVADMLNSRGHDVTVYERSDRPGGLLMYGIPNMKLEKEVIDRKIAYMEKRGIRFILNTEVATGKSTAKSPYPKDDQITGYLKNPNQKYVKAVKGI